MRMYEIADKPRKAKHWRSFERTYSDGTTYRIIYHYTTEMLSFAIDENGKWDGKMDDVDYSTGYGSVSDQQGMNKLFGYLGMPLYFRRAGGAEIVELDKPQFKYGISRAS